MDNIERLLRDADPRASRDSGGPLPLDLSDPAPVFIQRPTPADAQPRRAWWPTALGAAATAAAVAAVLVWAPWNAQAPDPLPANPPTQSTVVPEPSESSATDPTGTAEPTAAADPSAWPNGLFPAWTEAHFADDEACRALSVPRIKVEDAGGKISSPGYDARAFALIGCLGGYAAFTPTDQFRAEENIGDTSGGMLLATWNPETRQWVSSPTETGADGVEVHPEYPSWPLLRGYTYEPDETPQERMDRAIKQLGIDQELAQRLLGPNIPSWMEAETGAERIAYGNTLLEVTHPSWDMYEVARDGQGRILDPATADPRDADTYQLMFFDAHGKAVFNLGLFPRDPVADAADDTCNDPSASYTLAGLSPTSVVVEEGKLALGLVTRTDARGIESSTVSLVPAESPAQGRMCDLATAFHHGGKMVQSDLWTGYLGFSDAAERDAYLESPEYLRSMEVAASLELK